MIALDPTTTPSPIVIDDCSTIDLDFYNQNERDVNDSQLLHH